MKDLFQRFADGEDRADLLAEYSNKLDIKKSQFYRLFENPIYMGYIDVKAYRDFQAERVQGKHKAIISEELFEQIQQRIAETENTNRGQSWVRGEAQSDEFYWSHLKV